MPKPRLPVCRSRHRRIRRIVPRFSVPRQFNFSFITDGGGHDILEGNDGDDELIGGRGHDLFDGGAGADRIRAQDGERDTIFADLADLLDLDLRDQVTRRRRPGT